MALFTTPCPVNAREQRWIEESTAWFRARFGEPRPVLSPFLEDDLLTQVCRHMGIDPATLTVERYGDSGEQDLAHAAGLALRSRTAAGHFRLDDGRPVIALDRTLTPVRLVATIAHELGHVLLADVDRDDLEPLTDLLTVHFGLGVFAANAAFEVTRDHSRRTVRRLGYLTVPMFGYGLACHAWQRGERRPAWARRLATNPRVYLRRGLRYLAVNGLTVHIPPS